MKNKSLQGISSKPRSYYASWSSEAKNMNENQKQPNNNKLIDHKLHESERNGTPPKHRKFNNVAAMSGYDASGMTAFSLSVLRLWTLKTNDLSESEN